MDNCDIFITARGKEDDSLLSVLIERTARGMRFDTTVKNGDLSIVQFVLRVHQKNLLLKGYNLAGKLISCYLSYYQAQRS